MKQVVEFVTIMWTPDYDFLLDRNMSDFPYNCLIVEM